MSVTFQDVKDFLLNTEPDSWEESFLSDQSMWEWEDKSVILTYNRNICESLLWVGKNLLNHSDFNLSKLEYSIELNAIVGQLIDNQNQKQKKTRQKAIEEAFSKASPAQEQTEEDK